MSSQAADRGVRKGLRTLLQTIAGGGLTALVTLIAGGLGPAVQAVVMAVFTAAVALVQNYLETAGAIPTILPTRTTVGPAAGGLAVATVGAVIEEGGQVVGEVLDTAGTVVGTVTGHVDPEEGDQ